MEDIADDIGTERVVVTPTEDVRKEEGEPTDKPIEIQDGYGTEHPEFEQNEDSKVAEQVDLEQIKEDGNDYTEDRGGAHDDEYAPVEDKTEEQAQTDSNYFGITEDEARDLTQDEKEEKAQEKIEEAAEMTDEEFEDILKDFGYKRRENENTSKAK